MLAELERGLSADRQTWCVQAFRQAPTWPDVELLGPHIIPLGHMGGPGWTWGEAGRGLLSRLDVGLFRRLKDGHVAPGILVRPCEVPRFRDEAELRAGCLGWASAIGGPGAFDRLVCDPSHRVPSLDQVLHLPPEQWPIRRPRSLALSCRELGRGLPRWMNGMAEHRELERALEELVHLRDGLRSMPPAGQRLMPLGWGRPTGRRTRRGAPRAWSPEPIATLLGAKLPRGYEMRAASSGDGLALKTMGRFAPVAFALHVLAASDNPRLHRTEAVERVGIANANADCLRRMAETEEHRRDASRRRRGGSPGRPRHIGAWAVISGQDVVPAWICTDHPSAIHRVSLEWLRTPGFCETFRILTENEPERCRFLATKGSTWRDLLEQRHGWFVGCQVLVQRGQSGWSAAVALADEAPMAGQVFLNLAGFVPEEDMPEDHDDALAAAAVLRDRQLGHGLGEVTAAWTYQPSAARSVSTPPSRSPALRALAELQARAQVSANP